MTLVCKSGNYTRERGMDIRFFSLLAGLGLPNIYHDLGMFYKITDYLGADSGGRNRVINTNYFFGQVISIRVYCKP